MHYPEFCYHCETIVIICGTCGNNTCNGGYGTLPDGTECPDCESAYELYKVKTREQLENWLKES